MRLGDINRNGIRLEDIAKIASTNDFKVKVNRALYTIETFYKKSKRMLVSCGGGKDGTAVLILTKMITPDFEVVCADPPNPLDGRSEHIQRLENHIGKSFIHVPYDWDVDKVLRGQAPYPKGLKMRRLSELQASCKYDILWGCRNEESRKRTINYAMRGDIYTVADGTMRCQPIAKWTAEDSLALILASGYPVNDVYTKMDGFYNLNDIHDGTWWPHGSTTIGGWIAKYYPQHYAQYLEAQKVDTSKHISCTF